MREAYAGAMPRKISSRLGASGMLAIAVMLAFLGWACWYAVHAWGRLAGVEIGVAGWFFIVTGVVLTVAVGAGLMALVFYSSRHDYDR